MASLLTLEIEHGEDIRAQEFQWRKEKNLKREEEQDNRASEVDMEPDSNMDPARYSHTAVAVQPLSQSLSQSGIGEQSQNRMPHRTIAVGIGSELSLITK